MAVSKFPDSPKAMECNFMAGESYVQKGDFAKARGYFLTVLGEGTRGKVRGKIRVQDSRGRFPGRELRAGEESRLDEFPSEVPGFGGRPRREAGPGRRLFQDGLFR